MLGLAPAAVPAPVTRCTVDDPRLTELSGLAVVGGAVWAMADGGSRVELLRLDPGTCAVLDRRTAAVDPYDAEDLAAGPDGALWVGDTGDNERRRGTVAVVVVPADGPPRLHRLTYPDGPHDAEALLVDARGVPTVVTKDVGVTGVYQPPGPLSGSGPTPLVRLGDLPVPTSDTVGGPLGALGSRLVTGGAVDPTGRVVAVRTYTDAWLYPVPDGAANPVADALRGTPVRVPLPDEPQGEAVAFTADGTLLSGSEARGGVAGPLRAVPGAVALAGTFRPSPAATGAADATTAPGDPATAAPAPDPAWWPAAIGAAALVAVLGGLGVALARRGRRR